MSPITQLAHPGEVAPIVDNRKPTCLVIIAPDHAPFFYGEEEWNALAARTELLSERPLSGEEAISNPSLLERVEILFTGWGGPALDARLLACMPRLRAVFFAGGTVKGLATEAFWAREVPLVSAAPANARPVAEYTVAALIFGLKGFMPQASALRAGGSWDQSRAWPGCYRVTVGLVSFGAIAREVRRMLESFSISVIVFDPYLSEEQAQIHRVTKVGLDELFELADAVSIHTPWLEQTEKMIRKEHLLRLPRHATFINSARGAVVDEADLVDVLRSRPEMHAFLDVTYPDPPAADSPLLSLPNVFLTPHVAGSIGPECKRMVNFLIAELDRLLANQPLKHTILKETLATSA